MIQYKPTPAFPGLAWLATVSVDTGKTSVAHGCYVETRPGYFFEGAWAGDFTLGRPDETEVVFGSGALLMGDETLFVSSLATTDYLFYKRTPSTVTVANSLPLLLAAIDDELDPAFRRYAEVNNSIINGIDEHERNIPTRRGSISRLLHHNLRIGRDSASEIKKLAPPSFPTYESYASYLAGSYALLAGNARDSHRSRPLKIYSTQSRGYDSTAINAIAARLGLDGVFTLKKAKGGGAFSDQRNERESNDDGTEIARILGISNIITLDRRAFRRGFPDEVYYHASIHEPQDANLKQISEHIAAPALLLTGTLGELWYTAEGLYKESPEYTKPDLHRMDISLHGLTEPRLRAGYIQAALPYIGARNRADIIRITESNEMNPWRIGTWYDRPIPRRLAESAGVPRSEFGQVKIGSVVEFTPPQLPQDAALREAYRDFLHDERLCTHIRQVLFPLVHGFNRMSTFASKDRHRLIYYGWRLASKLAGKELRPRLLWTDLRGSLYCFAVNRCAREYRAALVGTDRLREKR